MTSARGPQTTIGEKPRLKHLNREAYNTSENAMQDKSELAVPASRTQRRQ